MPRPPRINFPGAVYHVLNRFIDKHPFFKSEFDYRKFLECYFDVAASFGIVTYSWCLMPNHFHFCIELTDANLSEFLQRFLTRAAKYLNYVRGRTGHLLQDRTRTLLIDTENYFETAVGYILMNPVRAGLAPHPLKYRWCSAQAMLTRESVIPAATLAERVTGRYIPQGSEEKAHELLASWLDQVVATDYAKRFGEGIRGTFLGTLEYRKKILDSCERRVCEVDARRRREKDDGLREFNWSNLLEAGRELIADKSWAASGGWSSCESAANDLLSFAMYDLGQMTYDEIAAHFGDRSTLSKYKTAVHRIRANPKRIAIAREWCQAVTSLLSKIQS